MLKYLLLLAIIPFLLLPTFAQENVIIRNDENTPFVYKDLEGYTIVNGTVYNASEVAINNVRIIVHFFDDFDSSPLESLVGHTTLEVITSNDQSPFAISSETPNPNITQATTTLLSYDGYIPSKSLTITTDKPTYNQGNIILISGQFNNLQNDSSLNISLQSPDGNQTSLNHITTNNDTYSTFINTKYDLFISTSGLYTLTSNYGTSTASTTFDYYTMPIQQDNEYFIPPSSYLTLSDHEIDKWNRELTKWQNAQNRTDSQTELYYENLDDAISKNQTNRIDLFTQKIGNSMALSELYGTLIDCLQEQLDLYS